VTTRHLKNGRTIKRIEGGGPLIGKDVPLETVFEMARACGKTGTIKAYLTACLEAKTPREISEERISKIVGRHEDEYIIRAFTSTDALLTPPGIKKKPKKKRGY
jgi:hypothetical protein